MFSKETRFQPPATGRRLTKRRTLLAQLRLQPRRLTTIVAPAGYGKTSLAAQWHEMLKTETRPPARVLPVWVSLEPDDCDKGRFLLILLEALAPLLPDDAKGLDAGSMPAATLFSVLVTRLRRIDGMVVLFLDDYHFAQADATEALVSRLLSAGDLAHVKLVLISRSPPRFATSALRLEGEIKQIGVTELSFSDGEAQEFFSGRATILTREQVGALNRRTEGWAVALQMVRVLVNDTVDSGAILASFDGGNTEMGRYLSEQVFSSLPEDIRAFLVETAALPAVSRDLAHAISGDAAMGDPFRRLRDHALPLATMDPQGLWIRYHPVFGGFLAEEAARRGIDTRHILRKAASWFAEAGDVEAAVRHALIAADPALAAGIIEAAGGWRRVYATTRGGTALFQTLIEKAAEIPLTTYPLTTLGLSVISAKAGALDAANHYLAIAERAAPAGGDALLRDLRVVRVLLSLYTDRRASAADLAALEADLAEPVDMPLVHRALALNMLSYNFLITTDLERALHYGRLAMRAFRDGGADFGAMHLYTHIGQAAYFSGDTASAHEAYRSLIAEAQAHIGKGSDLDAVGQVLESEILSMRGDTGAAVQALAWALPHLERHDSWFDLMAAGFMAQQRAFRLGGDLLAAHGAIDSARGAARRRGFDRLTRLIDGERAELLVASGDVDEAVRYADVSGLSAQTVHADGANTFALHLRGSVPALLWTRIHLASGDPVKARGLFEALVTRQSQKPHVPRRIELAVLDIRLLIAEGREATAAARLSDLLLSLPVADYRAILHVEGPVFLERVARLAATMSVPEVVARRLADVLERPADGGRAAPASGLTERECAVIRLLGAGLSNKEIGRKLDLSNNTVKFHLRNIYAKLNATTRTGAVAAARAAGIV